MTDLDAERTLVLHAGGVSYRYPGAETQAVRDVEFSVEPGAVAAIVGPNGSGKSTLLKLLTGALRPDVGTVSAWGRPVTDWSPRELAQRLGVVIQREAPAFPVTVRDLVASGRYAHQGAFRSESAADKTAVGRALDQCGIRDLGDRSVRQLSGGEFQRARIARALAQEPQVLVLDEPTAALDVRYQMAILELLRGLADTHGLTLVFVTHRLALAARFADRLLLMSDGAVVGQGRPDQVLRAGTLSEVYGWPLSVVQVELEGPVAAPQIVPLPSRTRPS